MIRVALFAVAGTALALVAVALPPEQLAEWIPGLTVAGLIVGLMLGLSMAQVIADGDRRIRHEQAHAEIVELIERQPMDAAAIVLGVFVEQLESRRNPEASAAGRALSIGLDAAVSEHRLRIWADGHELVGDEQIER